MSTEHTAAIEREASAWLIRRDSGTWTPQDQAQFEEWLAASTLHKVAYLRLELAWEDAARLKALGAGVAGDRPPPRGQWNLTPFFEPAAVVHAALPRGRRHLMRLAIAAGLVLAAGVGFYALILNGVRDHYKTAVGRIESVPLQDGSKVTLNTDSEIRIRLTEGERQVSLEHGEAFFLVAKDPHRPFVVKVGDKRVIAVGTQFSVRREVNDAEVVVTEGQVRVEDAGETLLTPGSIARAGDAGVLVQRKTVAEAQEQLSWRSGILRFRDQTLGEAAAEFNRYNERKILIADPKVASLRIEGNFRATNVDAFVRLLERGFPVRARSEDQDIVITASEPVTH